MAAPIEIREASIGYAGRIVLRDVALTIRAGERIAVVGRSGAGKSTLLNVIYERCAGAAALVPQSAALVRQLSVFHNVFMGRLDRHPTLYNLKTLAWPGRRDVEAVERILRPLGLADAIFRRAGELSGGQQQRASVARALYNGRAVVIGDEPVSALDQAQGAAVLDIFAQEGRTLVFALHDVALALAHATRVLALDDGRIALDAPARSLRADDLTRFYAQ